MGTLATQAGAAQQWTRKQRWRRFLVKNEFIFYQRNLRLSRSVQYASGSKNVLMLNKQWQRLISNGNTKNRRHFRSTDVLALQRTTLSFFSLNLLFGGITARCRLRFALLKLLNHRRNVIHWLLLKIKPTESEEERAIPVMTTVGIISIINFKSSWPYMLTQL